MTSPSNLCDLAAGWWDDFTASSHLDDPARPQLRLEERDGQYRLRTQNPALRADALIVESSRRELRVEGVLQAAPPPWVPFAPLRKQQRAHFSRVYRLQSPIDPSQTRVCIEDGLLDVRLAKQSPNAAAPDPVATA